MYVLVAQKRDFDFVQRNEMHPKRGLFTFCTLIFHGSRYIIIVRSPLFVCLLTDCKPWVGEGWKRGCAFLPISILNLPKTARGGKYEQKLLVEALRACARGIYGSIVGSM